MGDKCGDQQSRVELLGKLLSAAGDKPYILRHGTDKESVYMVLLDLSDEEVAQLENKTGQKPTVIRLGKYNMIPMQLEAGNKPGDIDKQYYDIDMKRWTATIALMRFK